MNDLKLICFFALLLFCTPLKAINELKAGVTNIEKIGISRVAAYLTEAGYFKGDFKYAKLIEVQAAIRLFQRDLNIPETGYLENVTWKTLQTIRLSNAKKRELGHDVSIGFDWAQHNFDLLEDPTDYFDGALDSQTQAALRDFQKQYGLPIRDILTPTTFVSIEQAIQSKKQLTALEHVPTFTLVETFMQEVPELPKSWSQQELIRLISTKHYKHPRIEKLKDTFKDPKSLNRYLKKLDPYSRYFLPERSRFHKQRQAYRQVGLGINILIDKNALLVVPIDKGPAYQAGIRSPYYLLSLNKKKVSLDNFSSYRFLTELSAGEEIPLLVSKKIDQSKTKTYKVNAGLFEKNAIEYLVESERDIIRIHNFEKESTQKLKNVLHKTMKKNKDIIIDLRYCPGGDLYETIDAVSLFLPPDLKISYLNNSKNHKLSALSSLKGRVIKHRKGYVWTSFFTSSAAEVFARALQYYNKNSVIIGTPTKGKCLSQQNFEFDDGAVLQLSVLEILGPDKKTCEGVGLRPDRPVDLSEILDDQVYLKLSQ